MNLVTSFMDRGQKRGSASIPVLATIATADITALLAAIEGATLGTRGDVYLNESTLERTGSNAIPSSGSAQRTNKWLVSCIDANGNRFQFTLPTADLDTNVVAGSHLMDTGAGTPGETLVNAIESHVVSPIDESAVTVESIAEVSRGGQ